MERLTDKNHYAVNECNAYSSCYSCRRQICYINEMAEKLGELEDVLGKYGIESAEELDGVLKPLIDNGELENWKRVIFWKSQNERLKQELAELKQKAIVLPFEFDKPFYKLCPKCNDRQTDCKHCAWGGCGFNQCYDICHKENKGQIIREITFKKDNCNVSWNAIRFISEHWGEYYFATKEEAEQKLAELKGEKDE